MTSLLAGYFSRSVKLKRESLLGRLAAVGSERRTSAERRLVGRDKQDGLGYLFGPAHAFERHSRDQAGLPFVIPRKPAKHRSVDRTGRDRIDAHPRRRRLKGCRLR